MTIVIDMSHGRATDFDTLLIGYAIRMHDFEVPQEDAAVYATALHDMTGLISGLDPDESERLRWLADDALEFINERVAGASHYVIEDNSLFLVPDTETDNFN